MFKKIAIISYTSRAEGCFCGVEKFNWYLQKAIGGVIYTATQFKMPSPVALNNYLLSRGVIDKDTICIVDGSWGLGLPEDIPVISIVHGTWAEFNLRNNGKIVIDKEQDVIWHRKNMKTVAVSQASAKYLKKHHGVTADKIILNGIDTKLFCPLYKTHSKPIVLHGARDYNKDSHGKLRKVIELLAKDFIFKYIDSPAGSEQTAFKMADMFLQISNYEGNSYASLEAMACGLPLVASSAGLFEDTDFGDIKVGEVIPWDACAEMYAGVIKSVWKDKGNYNPRTWVLENATYEIFAKQWKEFINEN